MLGLGAWVLACMPNASGVGNRPIGVYDGGGTTETSGTTGPGGTEPGVPTGSADATDGSGMPTTTLPPDDSGDGEGSSTTTTTGEPSDGTSTGEVPPPLTELLEHASFDACNLPLWCYSNGDIFDPAGGPMWMQECFTATLEPPFELTELEAVVSGLHLAVGTVQVQVRERTAGGGPGATIATRIVSVVGGHNTIAVVPPIAIDQAEVCIGLAATQSGLAGALGVAVNESATEGGISWFRLEGGEGCNYPSWADVIAETPTPTGNWCIRGTIAEQQRR